MKINLARASIILSIHHSGRIGQELGYRNKKSQLSKLVRVEG